MMYESKLVASLKANGKILREFKDTVYIPFGSEYSFLIKNLNTKRALVYVHIDGESVIENGLVLNAGQEIDLERYVKNGNLSTGNKFKFIERTSSIEKHRGAKLEDGLIRIEFQFEKEHPMQAFFDNNKLKFDNYYSKSITRGISGSTGDWAVPMGATYCATNISGSTTCSDTSMDSSWLTASGASLNATAQSLNDVGITVPGSQSNQKFTTTTMGVMEAETHNIIFKLLGETEDNKPVLQPVNVKMKPKCNTCGKQNKATNKFCSECGTSLELFA
jgi:hypothetical protein